MRLVLHFSSTPAITRRRPVSASPSGRRRCNHHAAVVRHKSAALLNKKCSSISAWVPHCCCRLPPIQPRQGPLADAHTPCPPTQDVFRCIRESHAGRPATRRGRWASASAWAARSGRFDTLDGGEMARWDGAVGTSPLLRLPLARGKKAGCRSNPSSAASPSGRREGPNSLLASLGTQPASCEQYSASTMVINPPTLLESR